MRAPIEIRAASLVTGGAGSVRHCHASTEIIDA